MKFQNRLLYMLGRFISYPRSEHGQSIFPNFSPNELSVLIAILFTFLFSLDQISSKSSWVCKKCCTSMYMYVYQFCQISCQDQLSKLFWKWKNSTLNREMVTVAKTAARVAVALNVNLWTKFFWKVAGAAKFEILKKKHFCSLANSSVAWIALAIGIMDFCFVAAKWNLSSYLFYC